MSTDTFVPFETLLVENSFDIMGYVYGQLQHGADADVLAEPVEPIAYRSHCQQRTLGVGSYTESVLPELEYDFITSVTT